MKISLNDQSVEVSQTRLDLVLAELGYEGVFATAVNEHFVPVGLREKTELSDSDRLEIVAPMQGG